MGHVTIDGRDFEFSPVAIPIGDLPHCAQRLRGRPAGGVAQGSVRRGE